jgi:hypothetical protein
MDQVTPRPIEWLWPGWIPLGKTITQGGDPGLGKSTLLLDLAARVSTDGAMPDGSQGATGRVVILSAEDAIRPRLEAAGADLTRITILDTVTDTKGPRPLQIPLDLPSLKAKLQEVSARLLIIDPLSAFLVGPDANKDQEVRRALYDLYLVSREARCTSILMRHLNKRSGGSAMYRGNMSIAVIGHSRAGLLVARDPDDDRHRILAMVKCNYAAEPPALRYHLEPMGQVCRVGWIGQSHYHADDLVQQQPTDAEKEEKQEARTKRELCKELIDCLLAHGPKEIRWIKKECAEAGFSRATVERAAKDLGVVMSLETVGGKNLYYWQAPGAEGVMYPQNPQAPQGVSDLSGGPSSEGPPPVPE